MCAWISDILIYNCRFLTCRKYHIANSKLSVQFDSVQKTEFYTVYIRYKSYQFESIIYVPFSWYHFAGAHCIVLM